ncbi:MAG: hypothetical protein EBZ61_06625 [Micrococcales bacterium]|nr:hypothetical protein [Micrococcales bacterium]
MQCNRDRALDLFYGRMNDCLDDIKENIKVNLADELKNMKLDLVLWAMDEANKNITHAAKMLNLNRTTLTSMISNELAPYIRKRKVEKRRSKDRQESVDLGC